METQRHFRPATLGTTLGAMFILWATPLQADPPSGVHHDALRGYWSLDSVSSTQADDLSGLDHHAALTLPIQATPGFFGGGSLQFGSGSVMTLDNTMGQLVSDGGAPFTVSFWTRIRSSNFLTVILRNDDASFMVGVEPGNGEVFFANAANSTIVHSIDYVYANAWHHVAVTYDGDDLVIYLNGEEQGIATGPVEVANSALIARFDLFDSNQYGGEIDELRIHSEALTPEEVAHLALLVDADGNGIDDNWEEYYFSETGIDPNADADNDGLNNHAEYLASTDPTESDTDSDGMSDGWEVAHGLNPGSDTDASADPDGDGYTNLQEYRLGRNPHQPAIPDTTGLVNLVVNRPL